MVLLDKIIGLGYLMNSKSGEKTSYWWLQIVAALVCLILFYSCTNSNSLAADKTLTIAVEGTYPPFEFQTDKGELQGFDVDLMNAIARVSGFKITYQNLPFAGMIPASSRVPLMQL